MLGLDASQHNEKYFQGSLVVHTTNGNGHATEEEVLVDAEEIFKSK